MTNSTAKGDKSLRSFSAVFPLQFLHIDQTHVILCSCSTEHVNFDMFTLTCNSEQKGCRRLFMQNIPAKVSLTTNFDQIHKKMNLRHVFKIPLPNSDYAMDNVLVAYFVYIFSTLICENTLFLSCFDKEGKCLLKDG